MKATYLVELDLDSPEELTNVAEDIHLALENVGMSIIAVKPWARQNPLPLINPIPL